MKQSLMWQNPGAKKRIYVEGRKTGEGWGWWWCWGLLGLNQPKKEGVNKE